MRTFHKLYRSLAAKNFFQQIIILLIGSYVITIITAPIVFLFGNNLKPHSLITENIDTSAFFFIVIIVPLIETFLNQYAVYNYLNKYHFFKKRQFLIIIVSGVSFGLLHYYSIAYIIWAIFLAYIFAFVMFFLGV